MISGGDMTCSQTLTDRERRFVDAFLISRKQTDAYIKAGYSPKSARANASRMMDKENIRAAIAAGDAVVQKRQVKTLDDLVERLSLVAFSGMERFVHIDADGQPIIDLSRCTPMDLSLLSEITTETFIEGKGDDAKTVRKTKIKLNDNLRAMEMLGKHLGLFKEGSGAPPANPLADALREIMARGSALPVRIMGPLGSGIRPMRIVNPERDLDAAE